MRAMLLWHSCLRARGVADADFAMRAWMESEEIERLFEAHTCNVERAVFYHGREILFKCAPPSACPLYPLTARLYCTPPALVHVTSHLSLPLSVRLRIARAYNSTRMAISSDFQRFIPHACVLRLCSSSCSTLTSTPCLAQLDRYQQGEKQGMA
jgi:hypothetical protein